MGASIRKTALDLPRAVLLRKSYTALICDDGTILPIEEKLGRRLLRTIDPASREGRELLRRDAILLTSAEGPTIAGLAIDEVLDRLSRRSGESLARHGKDRQSAQRSLDAKHRIGQLRRSLAREH